ncbi:MAG: hypothetical protein QM709_09575 [Spongiibacteraceae bacterium]
MSSVLRKRFTSLLIPTFVLAVLLHEFLTTPVYTDRELDSMRESAVALAQQGDIETALEKLRALSEVAPKNRAIWGDYLTELVRAGRDAAALTLYRRDSKKPLPDYALTELFDAAVRQRDVALARELADREIAQSADRAAVAAAREQALLAAGLISAPPTTAAPVAENAVADEISAQPQSMTQQQSLQKKTSPDIKTPKNNSRRIDSRSPSRSAIPVQAAPQLHGSKPLNATAELAERARSAVRRAEQAPVAERIETAQQALPVVDEYIAAQSSQSSNDLELRNANLDRVRVLTLANRLDEAAELFDSLGDAHALPTFGLLNGADLFARRHELVRADALLDIISQREPDNRAALRARFYAQLERGDRVAAASTLERLQQAAVGDEDRSADRLLAATLAISSNDLPKAQQQLEELRAEQQDAAEVRERLGQIYRWRGWPRRALTEYSHAEQNGGESPDLHLAKAAAFSDAHDFVAARAEVEAAEKAAPEHPDLVGAQLQQKNRSRWEYEARALVGRSPDSSVNTEGDRRFEQKLWSPFIDDRYRVFAHHRYDWAEFPYEEEGIGRLNRYGLGAALYLPAVDASFEIHQRNPDAKIGIDLAGEWRFDDQFNLFAEYQSDSERVPLRAFNDGVNGHSIAVGGQFRVDENQAARLAYARTDFSDGNTRQTWSANYRQTLYRNAGREFNVLAQIYDGRNSGTNDVFYFNPAHENAATVTLEYGAPIWRGETSIWSHRVAIGGGIYRQREFSSEPIWDFEYEQRWNISPVFDLNYGVMHRSRVYDGERESYNAVFGGVNWHF